jgi:hypothetical protein
MSGKSFAPIPSGVCEPASGADFRPMACFRSALPISESAASERWFPPLSAIPSVPSRPPVSEYSGAAQWPAPMAGIPAAQVPETAPKWLPEIVLPGDKAPYESPFTAAPDYSDEDLVEALAPLMQAAVRQAVYQSERGKLDASLEPMLRATVRRALAEYSPASRPFQPPGFVDRMIWRFQALLSSRSFEDVLFEKTHRFQVEEVFLLDAETLSLVSFASCDPARHSAAKRIEASAQRIALQLRDEKGAIRRSFERTDGRNVICEAGGQMLLVAIVRGQPNELIIADLCYSLHRIEIHFSERFKQAGSAMMHALQPFLEDCLLIQAPGSAA